MLFFFRYFPYTETIKTSDGLVIEGNTEHVMTPATDVEVNPVGEDGQPIPGARVTLECGDPPRSYIGRERDDGSHIFNDAVPETGREECEMTVEAPG